MIPLGGFGQNTRFVATDSVVGSFSAFSIDNFGRIYLAKEDIIFQRYQGQDTLYSTSLKTLRPTVLESSKSFRTLVFDQERSIIHFFDNTLTDIHGEIDLINFGIQQPLLVCESFAGNTFWVLDGGMMRLVKLNRELETVSQTENLVTIFGDGNLPTQMLEYNDFLYILIPGKGVAVFDVFGTFIRVYATEGSAIGALNNYLLVKNGNQIEAVPNEGFVFPDFVYEIPDGVSQFMFTSEKVYFLTEKTLLIGKFVQVDQKD